MSRPPFLVIGTPRSRTAWLAAVLSPPGITCTHEPSVRWTSRSDLWAFLDRDGHGASDAGLTWFWQDVMAFRPDCRILVVRRPIAEVRASCRRVGIPLSDPSTDGLHALDAMAASAQGASPFVMSVTFADLALRLVQDRVFHHCIGGDPPPGWLDHWAPIKVEAPWRERWDEGLGNLPGVLRLFGERGNPVPRREQRA